MELVGGLWRRRPPLGSARRWPARAESCGWPSIVKEEEEEGGQFLSRSQHKLKGRLFLFACLYCDRVPTVRAVFQGPKCESERFERTEPRPAGHNNWLALVTNQNKSKPRFCAFLSSLNQSSLDYVSQLEWPRRCVKPGAGDGCAPSATWPPNLPTATTSNTAHNNHESQLSPAGKREQFVGR